MFECCKRDCDLLTRIHMHMYMRAFNRRENRIRKYDIRCRSETDIDVSIISIITSYMHSTERVVCLADILIVINVC